MKKLLTISIFFALAMSAFSQVTLVSGKGVPGNPYIFQYILASRDTSIGLFDPTKGGVFEDYAFTVFVHGVNLNSSTPVIFIRTSPKIYNVLTNPDSLKTINSFAPADSLTMTKDRFGYWNKSFSGEITRQEKLFLDWIHNSCTSGKIYIYVTYWKKQ